MHSPVTASFPTSSYPCRTRSCSITAGSLYRKTGPLTWPLSSVQPGLTTNQHLIIVQYTVSLTASTYTTGILLVLGPLKQEKSLALHFDMADSILEMSRRLHSETLDVLDSTRPLSRQVRGHVLNSGLSPVFLMTGEYHFKRQILLSFHSLTCNEDILCSVPQSNSVDQQPSIQTSVWNLHIHLLYRN